MSKGFSRPRAVAQRYQVHPSTLWRWCNEARFAYLNFPKPVPIGPNITAWSNAELDEYDARRQAERDRPPAA